MDSEESGGQSSARTLEATAELSWRLPAWSLPHTALPSSLPVRQGARGPGGQQSGRQEPGRCPWPGLAIPKGVAGAVGIRANTKHLLVSGLMQ